MNKCLKSGLCLFKEGGMCFRDFGHLVCKFEEVESS